jgi:pseudouridine synthase
MEQKTQRLDKFLSNVGIASRRGIKTLLKENEVTLNGKRVTENGTRIIPQKDEIKINGKKIKKDTFVYYLLNKPIGVISTSSDEYGRQNVIDLVDADIRVNPVGRLDKDTHGAILLTNDGELTHKLTHPKYHVPKKYLLKIGGNISEEKIQKLRDGITLNDGITAPAKVKKIYDNALEMEIFEGRYRKIRRMCEAIFINLLDLQRTDFGPIKLGNLKKGQHRELTKEEVSKLKESVNKS